MSAEEIESYKFQLEQVELALRSDPENEELTKLQSDLKELINMFEAANSLSSAAAAVEEEKKPIKKQQPADVTKLVPAATSTALKSREFAVDQEVMARWSGDGEYYKAVITAIGGTDQVFSVKFKGYSESEFVKAEDIKPVADKKRTGIFEVVEGSSEPKQKKKKDASTGEPTTKKKKTVEFENKKNAWLNFATGGNKKKKSATSAATSAINKKSIFKTPDNPEGKVGVIGSGKGMTNFQQRGKHVYSSDNHNNE